MPIYEFRCLACHEIFEFIFTSSDDNREMICPHCQSEDLERLLSTTNFSIAGSQGKARATATTRNCQTGTCSTLEIPGLGD